MRIGVPRERKDEEYRVGIVPDGVRQLRLGGHEIDVERGAGEGSGLSDAEYERAGARLVDVKEVWAAELVVKVKDPQPSEIPLLRKDQTLFTYLHFAADRDLTLGCIEGECVAVAYETLTDDNGHLPLLTPMSEIAGKLSIQEGAKYLERPQGGRGVLLGGVPGTTPARALGG